MADDISSIAVSVLGGQRDFLFKPGVILGTRSTSHQLWTTLEPLFQTNSNDRLRRSSVVVSLYLIKLNKKTYIYILSLIIIIYFIVVKFASLLCSDLIFRLLVIHIFVCCVIVRALAFSAWIKELPTKLVLANSLLTYYLVKFFLLLVPIEKWAEDGKLLRTIFPMDEFLFFGSN